MQDTSSKLIELMPRADVHAGYRWLQTVVRPVERALAFDRVNALYDRVRPRLHHGSPSRRILEELGARYEVAPEDAARIPTEGPLLVVANHPFGGVEGLILHDLLVSRRPDVKLMANYLLGRIEGLRDDLILVDPFGGTRARRRNPGPLRQSLAWLKEGHVLGVFPSGTVAHWQPRQGVADPVWSPSIAGLARRSGATVLPIFFEGSNGPIFQMAGILHPRLRTALLPSALMRSHQQAIRLRVGQPIPADVCASYTDDAALIGYLRFRTYLLEHQRDVALRFKFRPIRRKSAPMAPLILASDAGPVAREVESLPETCQLLNSGEYRVYSSPAERIPCALREIGRLREITFRAVGEGTGRAVDLDAFDSTYEHLFVWHVSRRELVGAYRVGRVDEIVARQGVAGLYTRTLFRFDERLIDAIGPALEMGRSFVRPEYQRGFAPLLLLWKGIGSYVDRHPRYFNLFGPVSISNQYSAAARFRIATYLRHRTFDPMLSPMVKARKPLKARRFDLRQHHKAPWIPHTLEELDSVLAETEAGLKSVPVLLRQYLKLGGTFLGLNVDPSFGNVLDGLLRVDLRRTPDPMLQRYFTAATIERVRAMRDSERREPGAA